MPECVLNRSFSISLSWDWHQVSLLKPPNEMWHDTTEEGCVRNVRKLLSILDFLLFLIYINRVVPSWGTGRDLLTTQKIVYVPHKLACTSTILPKTQSFAIFMHFLVILIIMWPHQKTHSGKAWCIYIFTILSLMMMLKNIKVLNFT